MSDQESLMHAVAQIQSFYGKVLDELQMKLWLRALRKYEEHEIKLALATYIEQGQFAPKPKHIIDLCELQREEGRRKEATDFSLPEPDGDVLQAPYTTYWRYVISQWGNDASQMFNTDLPEDEVEKAIEYVNSVATKVDSIPSHLRRGRWAA